MLVYSADANAWGLLTHLYFAQSLLWAMPLLDPRLQAAIRKFPQLVMAGACLPDLAIVNHYFHGNHHWNDIPDYLSQAHSEQDLAITIGYVSHLYVDVLAHNHFVPAHEKMLTEKGMVAHLAAEWAMDAHVSKLMDCSPRQLLKQHEATLIAYMSNIAKADVAQTRLALRRLAFWDNILRKSRLPNVIYRVLHIRDTQLKQHFAYYLARTHGALQHFGKVFAGNQPAWLPEAHHHDMMSMSEWRKICLNHLRLQHPHPLDYFQYSTQEL